MRALLIAAVAAAAANALRMRPRAAPPAQTSIGEANFFDLDPSSPAFVDLGVTGWQQTTDYTCGPSSVMSIMRFYGVLNASQMTHETEMAFAKGMGTRSDNGTDPILMAAWLQSVRFGSAWAQGGNISLVRDFLARGQPIVSRGDARAGRVQVAIAGDARHPATAITSPAIIIIYAWLGCRRWSCGRTGAATTSPAPATTRAAATTMTVSTPSFSRTPLPISRTSTTRAASRGSYR